MTVKLSLDSMVLISGFAGFKQLFQKRAFGLIWGRMSSLGFFRARMSSWCPFRCTCLDELESKCDVNFMRHVCLNCDFHVVQSLRFMDDFFWSGGFFGVVMDDSKTFAGFDGADFRIRWIQAIVPKTGFWPHLGSNVFTRLLPG